MSSAAVVPSALRVKIKRKGSVLTFHPETSLRDDKTTDPDFVLAVKLGNIL